MYWGPPGLQLPFPELREPRGGHGEEQPRAERPEYKREGELEQKVLGPELGVSGTTPASRIPSKFLTTGQSVWAGFDFRSSVRSHRWGGEEGKQGCLSALGESMPTPGGPPGI